MLTNLNKDTDERVLEELTRSHPLKRILSTTEVAESVKHLVTGSQHINGVNLIINAASDVI
jgi:hypothetical protein